MDFEDAVLVRLADPATRVDLFDQDSLAALAAAGYNHPELSGEYVPVFDSVELAVDLAPAARADGTVQRVAEPLPFEVRLSLTGLADPAAPRLTALWRGSVVARAALATDQVTRLAVRWPDEEQIDARIIARSGALPADAAGLEAARRDELRMLLTDAAGTTVLAGDAELDRWLELLSADSAGALLGRLRADHPGGYVRIGFAPGAGGPPPPRALPVAVALLARGAGVSPTALLADSAVVRQRLTDKGAEPSADPHLRRRTGVIVAWVLPSAVFDDESWPGGTTGSPQARRAARRAAAAGWLAERGIALVVTDIS